MQEHMLSVNLWHIFMAHMYYRLMLFENKLVRANISLSCTAYEEERLRWYPPEVRVTSVQKSGTKIIYIILQTSV